MWVCVRCLGTDKYNAFLCFADILIHLHPFIHSHSLAFLGRYIHVLSMRVCVRVCVGGCVCVCACVGACSGAYVCVRLLISDMGWFQVKWCTLHVTHTKQWRKG